MPALEQPSGQRAGAVRSARPMGQYEGPRQGGRRRKKIPFDLERLRAVLACQHCGAAPPHLEHPRGCPGARPEAYTAPLLAGLAGGFLHRKKEAS